MLKIAEYNTITGEKINLKELEKYGFKKWKYDFDRYSMRDITVCKNKHLIFHNGRNMDRNDTLYDLIKDGLVEKVSDNNE